MNESAQLPRITDVEVIGAHLLRITFHDGLVRELELDGELKSLSGVFCQLADPDFFAQVKISGRSICWPNDVDLDPDVLHGDFESASPSPFMVVSEHHLHRAS
jgi:Protein of unknown function (DUF2442)